MAERPSYFREALFHPLHKALFTATVLTGAGAFMLTPLPFLICAAAEMAVLVLLPLTPGFRRKVDGEFLRELEKRRGLELERVANKLTPNARSRLDGMQKTRAKIFDALRTLGDSTALEQEWQPRLDALLTAALRILVAVDSTRADERDQAFLDAEIAELEAAIAGASEGPARSARQQKLALSKKRRAELGFTREQREAAIVQVDMIEDMLGDLLAKGLSGRDAAAFGKRIEQLTSQIDSVGETVGTLDRSAELEAELGRKRLLR